MNLQTLCFTLVSLYYLVNFCSFLCPAEGLYSISLGVDPAVCCGFLIYVSNRDLNQTIIFDNSNLSEPARNDSNVTYVVKDSDIRLGGTFKIGVEGRIRDRFYINASFGVSALNLFFRDEKGGSLFNSHIGDNGKEEIIGSTHVTFMIQYRWQQHFSLHTLLTK